MKSPIPISAWIVPVVLAGGCLNFTAITSIPLEEGGRPAEAGADGAPAQTACLSCASKDSDAGGCASESARCNVFPECQATVQCVVNQCFPPSADILLCLGACKQDGGIASQGPPNDAFAAFLQCMTVHCQTVCLQ